MDLRSELTKRILDALARWAESAGISTDALAALPAPSVEVPRNRDHGDFATNAAMQLARLAKKNPRQVAEEFLRCFDGAGLVRETSIAGPGFINFRLETGATVAILSRIAKEGPDFGRTESGKGTRVLVEFVSANPTGPLHIGHARNAVVGDTIGRVMAAAGYEVGREYYFNDAGVQMQMLGNTLRLRVAELLGRAVEWPAQYYRGAYMVDIARLMVQEVGREELARRLDAVEAELRATGASAPAEAGVAIAELAGRDVTNAAGPHVQPEAALSASKVGDTPPQPSPQAGREPSSPLPGGESLSSPSPRLRGEKRGVEADASSTEQTADATASLPPDAAPNFDEDTAAPASNPYQYFTDFAVREILKTIDADMKAMGIVFDTWFSETSLHRDGSVDATLNELRALGKVYAKDGAQWLRTTEYGDEKDRVVVKRDGHYTYVAPDIAYHRNKYARGYHKLINVLGGDHHGYVPRLRAAVAALGHPMDDLQCVIIQMVSLLKDGTTMKLSTRGGEFITLKEMADELGLGVVRYFFAMRSPDTQMVFDWDLARSTSMDNPVYYVQYAHARCCSLLRKAEELGVAFAGFDAPGLDLTLLANADEQEIIRTLGRLPEVVDAAARDRAPHLVTNYLYEVAQLFHNFFTKGNSDASLRFVLPDQPALTQARLALIVALRTVLANALGLLGIAPMEKM